MPQHVISREIYLEFLKRKMTESQLAELAGVSRQTVSKALKGKAVSPRIVAKICHALGFEMTELGVTTDGDNLAFIIEPTAVEVLSESPEQIIKKVTGTNRKEFNTALNAAIKDAEKKGFILKYIICNDRPPTHNETLLFFEKESSEG